MTSKQVSSIIFITILMSLFVGCGKNYDKLTLGTSSCGTVTGADFFAEYESYSQEERQNVKTYDDYYLCVGWYSC